MIYNSKESKYDVTYANKSVGKLVSKLGAGKNLVLVSPKGFGTSNILRFLSFNKSVAKHYPSIAQFKFIYTGLISMFGEDLESLASAIVKAVLDRVTIDGLLSPNEYKEELQHLMIASNVHAYIYILDSIMARVGDQRFYIILDDFGKLFKIGNKEMFNLLRYIRDKYSLNINYILATSNLDYFLTLPDTDLDSFAPIANQQVFFLPTTDEEEIPTILKRYEENQHDYTVHEVKKIYDETGGYINYLHYLETHGIEHLGTGSEGLDQYSNELIRSLTDEQKKVLLAVSLKKEVPANLRPAADTLLAYRIIISKDGSFQICSSILAEYIHSFGIELDSENSQVSEFEMSLTRYEALAFKKLRSNQNTLVTRTDLIDEVWKDRKENIYSEWTLDQLMMRVRKKLTENKLPIKIITKRGRGYILTNTSTLK